MLEEKVLLAHPGTQYSYELARQFERCDRLHSFHTCLAVSAESRTTRLGSRLIGPLKVEREWQNRVLSGVPKTKLYRYPCLEFRAWWRVRRGGCARTILADRNRRFQQRIPDTSIRNSDTIVGFDTSSLILATRARQFGKRFVLDRSIGHPRAFLAVATELRARFPQWEDVRERKGDDELVAEEEEHQLASLVVVPSKFVADTLVNYGVPREKIRVNQFGTDTTNFTPLSSRSSKSRLVFLFVGSLTARKGVPLLLKAWRNIRPANAELYIVGNGRIPDEELRNSPASIKWLGAISRMALPALYRQADVFVFPSLFEGLAQVQLEAAACGLPIIATKPSGAEDIVEEGKTGFVIEAGSTDQLVQRMTQFIERPSLAKDMRDYAGKKAAQWSWSAYGNRWKQILDELV